jgi:putative transposase
MGHTYTQLFTHIVFSTKDRIPYLDESARRSIFAYIAGIARNLGASDVLVNGVADHAHLFLRTPPALAISEAVQKIKSNSSKWIHEERLLPHSFGWQSGYAAFSVSASEAAKTIAYIEDQETHHRKISFQEEYVAFLKRHGIPYDERYVWD